MSTIRETDDIITVSDGRSLLNELVCVFDQGSNAGEIARFKRVERNRIGLGAQPGVLAFRQAPGRDYPAPHPFVHLVLAVAHSCRYPTALTDAISGVRSPRSLSPPTSSANPAAIMA